MLRHKSDRPSIWVQWVMCVHGEASSAWALLADHFWACCSIYQEMPPFHLSLIEYPFRRIRIALHGAHFLAATAAEPPRPRFPADWLKQTDTCTTTRSHFRLTVPLFMNERALILEPLYAHNYLFQMYAQEDRLQTTRTRNFLCVIIWPIKVFVKQKSVSDCVVTPTTSPNCWNCWQEVATWS